jgi:hypothetical protein
MTYALRGLVNRQKIEADVQRAAQALAPAVVRIRYSFEDDWTGEPSIFFRIVLADDVAKRPNLSEIIRPIQMKLMDEVRPDEQGLNDYFDYRSSSEQADLKDPAWA